MKHLKVALSIGASSCGVNESTAKQRFKALRRRVSTQGVPMMKVLSFWSSLTAVALLALVGATGCTRQSSAPTASAGHTRSQYKLPRTYIGPARQLKKSEMTEAEIKYGIAPVPNESVTYQPDVIIVGGGAEAIRSQSQNGFIWTIDADAPHADELTDGKVFFLTNRAVGRVLELRHQGDALVVVVGPVDLTEIVSEAHIHIPATPIDLDDAIAYDLPEVPGQDIHVAQAVDVGNATRPAMYWRKGFVPGVVSDTGPGGATSPAGLAGPDSGYFLQRVGGVPDVSNQIKFTLSPHANASGVGVRVASNDGPLKVSAEVLVRLSKPTIKLDVDIASGLKTASIELTGAAGLTWKFEASSDAEVGAVVNAHELLSPSRDFAINLVKDLATAALPVSATFRQRFSINTALGVRNSALSATGDYTFKGGFKVGFFDGAWQALGPNEFHANQSLVGSTKGHSIAITGINLAHKLTVIAGIGVASFTAGPYVDFVTAVGVERNTDIGMLACNAAVLHVSIAGGAGYAIPESITSAINFILRAFGSTKQIAGYGGVAIAKPQVLINTSGSQGGCPPMARPAAGN